MFVFSLTLWSLGHSSTGSLFLLLLFLLPPPSPAILTTQERYLSPPAAPHPSGCFPQTMLLVMLSPNLLKLRLRLDFIYLSFWNSSFTTYSKVEETTHSPTKVRGKLIWGIEYIGLPKFQQKWHGKFQKKGMSRWAEQILSNFPSPPSRLCPTCWPYLPLVRCHIITKRVTPQFHTNENQRTLPSRNLLKITQHVSGRTRLLNQPVWSERLYS